MTSGKRRQSRGASLFALVTLAFWQMQLTWRLLIVCGLGILTATVLVCTMPLYSQVALSSGLHTILNATPTNSTISVSSTVQDIQRPNIVSSMTQQLTQAVQNDLGGTGAEVQPPFMISMGSTALLSSKPGVSAATPHIQLVGLEQDQLASHIHLVQGQLPRQSNGATEIALLPSVAHCLFLYAPVPAQPENTTCFSVGVGDEIGIASPFARPGQSRSSPPSVAMLRVVGLFTPLNEADSFWSGNSFGTESFPGQGVLITGLTSSDALASVLNHAVQNSSSFVRLRTTISLFWSYHLDVAQLDATNIAALGAGINAFLQDAGNISSGQNNVQTIATGPTDILNEFSSHITLAQVPVTMLLLLVVGMVILFISVITELLVERQTEAIALLRSRGASRRQVFGIFTMQMCMLCLLALVCGPLLAIPLTILLTQHLFSALDPNALALIATRPLETIWNIRWYAFTAVGLSLLSTLFTLYQTTRFDVLALRREASRPTQLPFWQRFYLDGLLAVLALGGYGYALYSINTGTLDPATGTQVYSPLIMGAVVLFLLACLLLFLRFLPHLIQLVGSLAARREGLASMIALAQIARAPRQVVRTILLLTLTTAFAIFSLVFSASQSQRIVDVVNYQVGADFSAQLSTNTNQSAQPLSTTALATETASYQAIPGVIAASLGIMVPAQLGNSLPIIKAVDARTFAQTAIWTSQDSTQSLNSLMEQLSANRKLAQDKHVIPAIVDAETWNELHLSPGQLFSLSLATIGSSGTQLSFLALDEVQHIPTMISVEGGSPSSQGILVDDQSFSLVFTKTTGQSPSINYIWLHTRTDKSALTSVRTALSQQALATRNLTVFDRQAFITALQQDPLTLNLVGILSIGALTPLVLALLGSLLLAWMNARSRLLSFAVLRALGSNPGQLIGVLSWEQGIVYTLMLILGMLYGILLSVMVLPSLLLTSVAISGEGSNAISTLSFQGDLPAIQVVIPPLLILVLALLVATCVLTLGLMARLVSHPSISQTLRLNAD